MGFSFLLQLGCCDCEWLAPPAICFSLLMLPAVRPDAAPPTVGFKPFRPRSLLAALTDSPESACSEPALRARPLAWACSLLRTALVLFRLVSGLEGDISDISTSVLIVTLGKSETYKETIKEKSTILPYSIHITILPYISTRTCILLWIQTYRTVLVLLWWNFPFIVSLYVSDLPNVTKKYGTGRSYHPS